MIRTCPTCGARNRVPARHLSDTGRCGSCKSSLPPTSEPIDVDAASFAEVMESARVPVMVDFWAPWCGPCKAAAPEVQELAREVAGRGLVLKVNTEQNPELAARFGVQAIPTFILFRNGHPAVHKAGLAPRAEMRRWFDPATYTA